ncbi:MAG TPA: hypothetical protein VKA89_08135 [Solirubrobacterales bacterium]|nr:hypothetical protein [Solirubrobacterales bacterium]
MDVNRLTQGEKIAAGSAIALFIIMFLKWYGVDEAGGAGDLSAWDAFDFIDLILLLTVIVTVGAAAAKASANRIDFPLSTAIAVLGGLSTLLVLFRLIVTPDIDVIVGEIDLSRSYGVFLGLIAAAGIAYGGWRAMDEEGTTFQDAADRFSGPGDGPGAGGDPGSRAATPPPPPPPPSGGTPPPSGGTPPPPPPSGGNPPPSGGA